MLRNRVTLVNYWWPTHLLTVEKSNYNYENKFPLSQIACYCILYMFYLIAVKSYTINASTRFLLRHRPYAL